MVPTVVVVDEAQDRLFSEHLAAVTEFHVSEAESVEEGLTALSDEVGQVLLAATKSSGGEGLGLSITLYYDQSNQMSVLAAGSVRRFLEGYLETVVRDKLEALGMNYDELSPPLSVSAVDVASGESVGRLLLSRLLPYFMVLAILAGAMGLGAEITAGEKERSTIATLLVSQLSRTEIVLGKFLTVLTISLVSSFLSAIGLLVGIRYFGGGLTAGLPSGAVLSLDAASFGWMLVVLVPLAVILAALVIIIGSYARSQKEASTYLLPIYMVIVLVGMVSMTGGATFRGAQFLIPVANALYALQDIIVGDVAFPDLLYTLAANVACGGLLIALAVRLFKREAVLFRS